MEVEHLHGLEILVDKDGHAFVCEEHMKFVKDNYGQVVGSCPHNDTNCFVEGCGKVATHCVEVPETWGGVPCRNFEITFIDYDGEEESEVIDISYDEDWGDIQDWFKSDGERYIGYGNEVDGYQEITKVVDLATGKEIDRFEWYEKVASYADDYSA